MNTKFSEDVIPLSDLKLNPGRIIKQVSQAHCPALLTSRGRGVAVMQSLQDFELAQEEQQFMRAVVAGLNDLESGRTLSMSEARERPGL